MKLKEALKGVLEESELKKVVKSYDIIGDTILIRVHSDLESKRGIIAEALHKIYPHVRSIAAVPLYAHTDRIYRTRDLEVIWGDENMETMHKESGCLFKVNPKRVFFSPRLSYERMRVASKVMAGETIINMFSGVGCFSIIIARMQPQTKIYSIDVNPYAYEYMNENVRLNRMEGRVIPILGDVREELKKSGLEGVADRVLMPLPEEAHSFLPLAVRALKLDKEGAGGVIHYYDVSTGRKDDDLFVMPIKRVRGIISSVFGDSLRLKIEEKRIVRSVAPRRYHVVLDLNLNLNSHVEGSVM
ncbi:MAG: class I SAM-dependent methyltransferase family protein [Methanophagales archaeon]|nr:class I SAM-dependent methyltransferase family protein [Methanophagales archaeon]MCW3138393.1 class I SAM-dependent methyltransferase family protein [Methanophagales archaeon]MCW3139639.1 class I SAM-dependent methyltransferase family protein [Methanophagales archaeon]MCW7069488.1 class I SAM-dependent methyltransferase family protein [Methanophagales archaeon]MCW7072842.1 class I SAM-dependent methyltransferase family protein [Methanophagales archaeon]